MSLLPVAGASLAAAAASLAGIQLVRLAPDLSRRASLGFVAFAGGTVLGAVFLHLLPEAAELAGFAAWPIALAAMLALYLVESHTLPHVHGAHSGDAEDSRRVHLGHLAAVGFSAHALCDGLTLGVGYRQGPALTTPALIAVLAHKVPEGMALLSLLSHGGFAPRRALAYAWLIAGLTPLAAVASFALLGDRLLPVTMGQLLALVAGSLLYVAACDLLPEVRRHPRLRDSALMLSGVAVMYLLARFGAAAGH